LDAVCEYLPSPLDARAIDAHDPDDETKVIELKPDDNGKLGALAFKLANDKFGSLTFFRVYSGTIKKGMELYNPRTGKTERAGRIVLLHANNREDVEEVYAGEIGALVGLREGRTGDTFCTRDEPLLLESINFAAPVISIAVEPKTKADQEKLGLALGKLLAEDPSLKVETNEETGQVIMSGMGELHLEIICDRLKREYGVETNIGAPQVAYKEAIRIPAQAQGKYVKQSGGRGQYGDCYIKVEPNEAGKGFEFINEVVGGVIPKEFIPAIQKGAQEAAGKGVLAGFPILDVKVTVYDGSYHDVDSSEIAFKLAAVEGFKEACKLASPVILEPIMKLEVVTPDEYMGDVIGDLNSRRGQVLGSEPRGKGVVVNANVPLENLFGYISDLRGKTKGQATASMEFAHYAETPRNIQDKIIASAGK
jgi:elongation factor G